MYVTIDPYYSVDLFNECKDSLDKNEGDRFIYMSIYPPFNWYFKVKHKPVLLKCDVCSSTQERYLVSCTVPVYSNEKVDLLRRGTNKGKFFSKFMMNDAYQDLKDSDFYVFNAQSRDFLEGITKLTKHKIWYFGRYFNKKYSVAMVKVDPMIKALIKSEDLLYFRSKDTPLERFEADFNYKVLVLKDKILKFSRTPYFENGQYVIPSVHPEPEDKFLRI